MHIIFVWPKQWPVCDTTLPPLDVAARVVVQRLLPVSRVSSNFLPLLNTFHNLTTALFHQHDLLPTPPLYRKDL